MSSLPSQILAYFRLFDRRARKKVLGLLFLIAFGAVWEALVAAIIVPFIAMISDPGYLQVQPVLKEVYAFSRLGSPMAFIVAVAVSLFFFFVLKNLFLAAVTHLQFKFVYSEMTRFSTRLFEAYMRAPYSFHSQTNSAVLIRNTSNEVLMYFTNVLVPAFILASEVLVMLAIVAILLWIAPLSTLIATATLGGLTGLFYAIVRPRIRRFGLGQQRHNGERIKWIKQGLGGIKETKVLGREEYFVDRFRLHEEQFSHAARFAMVLSQTPRLFVETIAFGALFLGVALGIAWGGETTAVLPVLALFAIAAVRLLPSVNRILLATTRIAYYRPAAEIVLKAHTSDSGAPGGSDVAAAPPVSASGQWNELRLENIGFDYPGASTSALENVNLTIPRGASIALVGPSGCGKTTLADVLLGLQPPTRGRILVDGVDTSPRHPDWQRRLGYIPQTIYLLDDSIRRNVAFGLPDGSIDDAKIWDALRLARIDGHVRGLPDGLSSNIGEDGSKLSGGQRQRIGIARALLRNPDILVLDEATSSLDEHTEGEIAETLEALVGMKTLIVIAHRPATIARCQLRYSVDRGCLIT